MAHILEGSHGASVQNSIFNVSTTYQTTTKGFEILTRAVAPNAFHNSDDRPDRPKCHKNTREAVIERVMNWVTGKIDTDAFMLWLYGPAGAGKSAIARSIAELCEQRQLLLASFLFFRSSNQRNTVKSLIANITYCITRAVPAAREPIETIIEADPLIFSSSSSLEAQFRRLVLEPLHLLSEQGHFSQTPLPPLVVIDGLDECLDESAQTDLIKVLSSSTARYQLPLKFLIASRPEMQIKYAFTAVSSQLSVSHLQLNNDFHPDEDIRRFLKDKFSDIQQHHPFCAGLPSVWPTEEQVDALVQKASGQFIYASLAVKFVDSAHHSPAQRLNIVLEIRPPVHRPVHRDLPFAELDALYMSILSRDADKDKPLVLNILGVYTALQNKDMPNYIDRRRRTEAVLGLEDGGMRIALSGLSSLLEVQSDRIVFHHASFLDFLFNKERSRDYYVDIQKNRRAIASWAQRLRCTLDLYLDEFGQPPAENLDPDSPEGTKLETEGASTDVEHLGDDGPNFHAPETTGLGLTMVVTFFFRYAIHCLSILLLVVSYLAFRKSA